MSSDSAPLSPEQQFRQENGMTVEEAWEKVKEWHLAGKTTQVQKGCAIILERFPEHEAKNLLEKKNVPDDGTQRKSIAEKMGGKLADTMEGFFHSHKVHASKPEPSAESVNSASKTTSSAKNEAHALTAAEPEEVFPEEPILDEERLFASISYAWIFCIIPLLLKKDSSFVQFHAKQGMVMAILITLFDFTIGSLLNIMLGGIGFVLKMLYLSVLCYAAYTAYKGKYWKIPGVYGLSQKIKL